MNWEFWVDVGGTFTDCLARQPDGKITTHKLLSSGRYKGIVEAGSGRQLIRSAQRLGDPPRFFDGFKLALADTESTVESFDPTTGGLRLRTPLERDPTPGQSYELYSEEEAPVTGIRWLMGRSLEEPIGPVSVRLGTTRGTNALLERQGAPTALVTTSGFADVLRIAYQNRPRLFDLHVRKSADLYTSVVEIDERIDAGGAVLRAPDPQAVRHQLSELHETGIRSLAICLLNSYRNDAHERMIEQIAAELRYEQISVSSRLSPLQRIVNRGDTTVVDAYLTPVIREYVAGIREKLPEADLKLMTSAGGLIDAEAFIGKDSILSGPAGGVVGAAYVAVQAGFDKVIGFDMGGTSTDVSRFDGEYERRYVMEVNDPESGAGVRVVAPMLAIETVAAGGGSICSFDGQKTVVGPRSAGSDPGPACYGKGGPLCVTDVNLYLGKIIADQFAFPLDRDVVHERLTSLCSTIASATGQDFTPEQLAVGFTKVANANMGAAIKKVSIARGYDVRDDVLVSFGGAGAQHACAIARELGIRTVLQHPYAGILSAFGIGVADVKKFAERDVGRLYSEEAMTELEPLFSTMAAELHEQMIAEGVLPEQIEAPRRLLDLRYQGQDSAITVAERAGGDFAADFKRQHKQLYGFVFPNRAIEIFAARLEMTGATKKPPRTTYPICERRPTPARETEAFFDDQWVKTAVFARHELQPGDVMDGPAIISEPISTIVVEPGWQAVLTERNEILLTDLAAAIKQSRAGLRDHDSSRLLVRADETPQAVNSNQDAEVDAITLELFNNRFASIADQMGATLQKTALSTNVKERLDFSCALFTPAGGLVVNAPHIPVHLGAMSETVRRLIADISDMRPGDVFVTNDPYRGGSHLPDVTVVTPVFDASGKRILFFTGSRAHHAEIGGILPGSMPPVSKSLAEEGVLIRAFRLVQGEQSSEESLRQLLSSGAYPSRSVDENIADVNAQVAANQTGVQLLSHLVDRYGLTKVETYMEHIQNAAERMMRQALLRIPEGEHRFEDRLDNGSVIAVRITVAHTKGGGEAHVDFTGTGPVMPENMNANTAIVRSAVLYCFRCLIEDDIPLNDGVLAPVTIHIPANCLLDPPAHDDPAQCAPIVGGNVETSQRVVDVLFGALGVAAASQGTSNNFLFGRAGSPGKRAFGYYETICGGSGAGPGFHGASAVHVHMTNTRITDPEVMEDRYPVRVRKFAIRRGSGGKGEFTGGDGVIREIEFLEPLEGSLLTNRRTIPPYGLAGGQPGSVGRNLMFHAGSSEPEELAPSQQFQTRPGDVLRIETPGGGGYGLP